jgi:hypothetical protein
LRGTAADIVAVTESLKTLRRDSSPSATLKAALSMENNAEILALYAQYDLL